MWTLWWIWMAAALALAFVEVLVSGWIFLGFAIGAALVGLIFAVGGPLSAGLAGSLPLTLVVFAVLSGYGLSGVDLVDATRILRSALHGFVSLETAGGFGMPQDVGRSFDLLVAGVDAAFKNWSGVRSRVPASREGSLAPLE